MKVAERLLHAALDNWVSSRIDRAKGAPITVRKNTRDIIFSRKNKIIYNRIPKNANSTVMEVMKAIRDAQGALPSFRTLPLKIAHSLESGDALLNQYDWLVVIRNPYARILSAFLDKMSKALFQKRFGIFTLDPEGFVQFLSYLDQHGPNVDPHFNLQTDLLYLPLDHFNVRIPFEDINHCLGLYFESLGMRHLLGKDFLEKASHAGTHHKTESSSKLSFFYTPDALALVNRIYRLDFETLGYRTANVPEDVGESVRNFPHPIIKSNHL